MNIVHMGLRVIPLATLGCFALLSFSPWPVPAADMKSMSRCVVGPLNPCCAGQDIRTIPSKPTAVNATSGISFSNDHSDNSKQAINSATYYRSTTCLAVDDTTPMDPIYETQWFRDYDSYCYTWIHWIYTSGTNKVDWRWYKPNGTLYTSDTLTFSGTYSWVRCWANIHIGDGLQYFAAADAEGYWHCDIYLNGRYIASEWFYIRFRLDDLPYTPNAAISCHTISTMYNIFDPNDPLDPGTTALHSSASEVCSWLRFTNVVNGFEMLWEWYRPDGTLYTSSISSLPDPGFGYYYGWATCGSTMYIDGFEPSWTPGQWTVKYYTKDVWGQWDYEWEDKFYISDLSLSSPNGNEVWTRNASRPITWICNNLPGNVNIHLNKGSGFDHTIISNTANDGMYSWLIPGSQAMGSDYQIVVQSASYPNVADISDGYFSIAAPSPTPAPDIALTSPNGTEVWTRNTSYAITWNSNNLPGNVNIHLNKGSGFDHTIVSNTENDGTYSWLIAGTQTSGSDYQVVVQSTLYPSVADISDSCFSIVTPTPTPIPSLYLKSPSEGDELIRGASYAITWESAGLTGDIHVHLNKGSQWDHTIAYNIPNDGHYDWLIPDSQPCGPDYQLVVQSAAIPSVADINEGCFSIIAAPPSENHAKFVDSGDYDGDGTSDIAIFQGSSGMWSVRNLTRIYFGTSIDSLVPADYSGNGTTDIAIFRASSGMWSVRNLTRFYLGGSEDQPVQGDYDGDGVAEAGIFRPSSGLWSIRDLTRVYLGATGDTVVPGFYEADDAKDIAIFRGSAGMWSVRNLTRFYFGASTDDLVPGDYNGAGRWEGGIFRPSTGLWSIRNVTRFYLGSSTDWSLPADYDGDGMDDAGIFRDSTGMWSVRNLTRVYFGGTGDIPVTR